MVNMVIMCFDEWWGKYSVVDELLCCTWYTIVTSVIVVALYNEWFTCYDVVVVIGVYYTYIVDVKYVFYYGWEIA